MKNYTHSYFDTIFEKEKFIISLVKETINMQFDGHHLTCIETNLYNLSIGAINNLDIIVHILE